MAFTAADVKTLREMTGVGMLRPTAIWIRQLNC